MILRIRGSHATGGYAFPGVIESPAGGAPGMDLRDWFAGKALEGLSGAPQTGNWLPENFAKAAYAFADAMLKEREK